MGTRADFYIGRGISAEWIGSIAWYAFDSGKVYVSCFGHSWFDPIDKEGEDDGDNSKVPFPNMKENKKSPMGR